MRKAKIIRDGEIIGRLIEEKQDAYLFRYDEQWLNDPNKPPVSLTMPKTNAEYRSKTLFPFFSNLASEGVNRSLQSRLYKIDENDSFGLLLATGSRDTIGAITVQPD